MESDGSWEEFELDVPESAVNNLLQSVANFNSIEDKDGAQRKCPTNSPSFGNEELCKGDNLYADEDPSKGSNSDSTSCGSEDEEMDSDDDDVDDDDDDDDGNDDLNRGSAVNISDVDMNGERIGEDKSNESIRYNYISAEDYSTADSSGEDTSCSLHSESEKLKVDNCGFSSLKRMAVNEHELHVEDKICHVGAAYSLSDSEKKTGLNSGHVETKGNNSEHFKPERIKDEYEFQIDKNSFRVNMAYGRKNNCAAASLICESETCKGHSSEMSNNEKTIDHKFEFILKENIHDQIEVYLEDNQDKEPVFIFKCEETRADNSGNFEPEITHVNEGDDFEVHLQDKLFSGSTVQPDDTNITSQNFEECHPKAEVAVRIKSENGTAEELEMNGFKSEPDGSSESGVISETVRPEQIEDDLKIRHIKIEEVDDAGINPLNMQIKLEKVDNSYDMYAADIGNNPAKFSPQHAQRMTMQYWETDYTKGLISSESSEEMARQDDIQNKSSSGLVGIVEEKIVVGGNRNDGFGKECMTDELKSVVSSNKGEKRKLEEILNGLKQKKMAGNKKLSSTVTSHKLSALDTCHKSSDSDTIQKPATAGKIRKPSALDKDQVMAAFGVTSATAGKSQKPSALDMDPYLLLMAAFGISRQKPLVVDMHEDMPGKSDKAVMRGLYNAPDTLSDVRNKNSDVTQQRTLSCNQSKGGNSTHEELNQVDQDGHVCAPAQSSHVYAPAQSSHVCALAQSSHVCEPAQSSHAFTIEQQKCEGYQQFRPSTYNVLQKDHSCGLHEKRNNEKKKEMNHDLPELKLTLKKMRPAIVEVRVPEPDCMLTENDNVRSIRLAEENDNTCSGNQQRRGEELSFPPFLIKRAGKDLSTQLVSVMKKKESEAEQLAHQLFKDKGETVTAATKSSTQLHGLASLNTSEAEHNSLRVRRPSGVGEEWISGVDTASRMEPEVWISKGDEVYIKENMYKDSSTMGIERTKMIPEVWDWEREDNQEKIDCGFGLEGRENVLKDIKVDDHDGLERRENVFVDIDSGGHDGLEGRENVLMDIKVDSHDGLEGRENVLMDIKVGSHDGLEGRENVLMDIKVGSHDGLEGRENVLMDIKVGGHDGLERRENDLVDMKVGGHNGLEGRENNVLLDINIDSDNGPKGRENVNVDMEAGGHDSLEGRENNVHLNMNIDGHDGLDMLEGRENIFRNMMVDGLDHDSRESCHENSPTWKKNLMSQVDQSPAVARVVNMEDQGSETSESDKTTHTEGSPDCHSIKIENGSGCTDLMNADVQCSIFEDQATHINSGSCEMINMYPNRSGRVQAGKNESKEEGRAPVHKSYNVCGSGREELLPKCYVRLERIDRMLKENCDAVEKSKRKNSSAANVSVRQKGRERREKWKEGFGIPNNELKEADVKVRTVNDSHQPEKNRTCPDDQSQSVCSELRNKNCAGEYVKVLPKYKTSIWWENKHKCSAMVSTNRVVITQRYIQEAKKLMNSLIAEVKQNSGIDCAVLKARKRQPKRQLRKWKVVPKQDDSLSDRMTACTSEEEEARTERRVTRKRRVRPSEQRRCKVRTTTCTFKQKVTETKRNVTSKQTVGHSDMSEQHEQRSMQRVGPSEQRNKRRVRLSEQGSMQRVGPSERKYKRRVGPSEQRSEQREGPSKQRKKRRMGPTEQRKKRRMGLSEQGSRQRVGPSEQGSKQRVGPSEQGSKQRVGPSEQWSKQRVGSSEQGSKQRVGLSEQGSKQRVGPLEQGSKQIVRPSEQGSMQRVGPSEQGSKRRMGPSEQGSKQIVRPSEEGSMQRVGPSEQWSKQRVGSSEQGSKQRVGLSEQGSKQRVGPLEQWSKQRVGPSEQGSKRRMGPSEQGSKQIVGLSEQGSKQRVGPSEQGSKQTVVTTEDMPCPQKIEMKEVSNPTSRVNKENTSSAPSLARPASVFSGGRRDGSKRYIYAEADCGRYDRVWPRILRKSGMCGKRKSDHDMAGKGWYKGSKSSGMSSVESNAELSTLSESRHGKSSSKKLWKMSTCDWDGRLDDKQVTNERKDFSHGKEEKPASGKVTNIQGHMDKEKKRLLLKHLLDSTKKTAIVPKSPVVPNTFTSHTVPKSKSVSKAVISETVPSPLQTVPATVPKRDLFWLCHKDGKQILVPLGAKPGSFLVANMAEHQSAAVCAIPLVESTDLVNMASAVAAEKDSSGELGAGIVQGICMSEEAEGPCERKFAGGEENPHSIRKCDLLGESEKNKQILKEKTDLPNWDSSTMTETGEVLDVPKISSVLAMPKSSEVYLSKGAKCLELDPKVPVMSKSCQISDTPQSAMKSKKDFSVCPEPSSSAIIPKLESLLADFSNVDSENMDTILQGQKMLQIAQNHLSEVLRSKHLTASRTDKFEPDVKSSNSEIHCSCRKSQMHQCPNPVASFKVLKLKGPSSKAAGHEPTGSLKHSSNSELHSERKSRLDECPRSNLSRESNFPEKFELKPNPCNLRQCDKCGEDWETAPNSDNSSSAIAADGPSGITCNVTLKNTFNLQLGNSDQEIHLGDSKVVSSLRLEDLPFAANLFRNVDISKRDKEEDK